VKKALDTYSKAKESGDGVKIANAAIEVVKARSAWESRAEEMRSAAWENAEAKMKFAKEITEEFIRGPEAQANLLANVETRLTERNQLKSKLEHLGKNAKADSAELAKAKSDLGKSEAKLKTAEEALAKATGKAARLQEAVDLMEMHSVVGKEVLAKSAEQHARAEQLFKQKSRLERGYKAVFDKQEVREVGRQEANAAKSLNEVENLAAELMERAPVAQQRQLLKQAANSGEIIQRMSTEGRQALSAESSFKEVADAVDNLLSQKKAGMAGDLLAGRSSAELLGNGVKGGVRSWLNGRLGRSAEGLLAKESYKQALEASTAPAAEAVLKLQEQMQTAKAVKEFGEFLAKELKAENKAGSEAEGGGFDASLKKFNEMQAANHKPTIKMTAEQLAREGLRMQQTKAAREFAGFLENEGKRLDLSEALKQYNGKASGQKFDMNFEQLAKEGLRSETYSDRKLSGQAKLLDIQNKLNNLETAFGRALNQGKTSEIAQLTKQISREMKREQALENKGVKLEMALPETLEVQKVANVMRAGTELGIAIKLKEIMAEKEYKEYADQFEKYKNQLTEGEQKESVEKAWSEYYGDPYSKALADAQLTQTVEKAWVNHYKAVYEEAKALGKLEAYTKEIEGYRQEIKAALMEQSTPQAMYEKFTEFRNQQIESGKIKARSIRDARMVSTYGELAFSKITGNSDMYFSQKMMLSEFFGGNNAGVKAGGGKTEVFKMFAGEAHIMGGKALRAEILVDDVPAIDKYIGQKYQGSEFNQGDMARVFGMEMRNGNELYAEGQRTGNFKGLIDALNSPSEVVLFDHTTRAHLRNTGVTNPRLREALGKANLVCIDEVHMAATSQTSAIIGGNVEKPGVSAVRNVDHLLNDLGFDYNYAQSHNGEAQLAGKGFEVIDLRGTRVTPEQKAQYNANSEKLILKTDEGVRVNTAALDALSSRYTTGEIGSVLKTLYSQQGKGGEYNSYAIVTVDGQKVISPVDTLGKIQEQQISNDIVGQITAARKHGLDPFKTVRVNKTSMQTSLSAMYAGNHGAHIVGASGTIAGIESLMQSKIGSSATHISTSMLDIKQYVTDTGGKILTDTTAADSIVIESIAAKESRNVLVFEVNPITQLELAGEYMRKLETKGVENRVIGVISAEGAGYYVPKGEGAKFVERFKLQGKSAVRDATIGKGEYKGTYEYVEVTKEAIQTVVENAGKDKQVVIFNEQAAVGKDFQAELTLVARGAHKLSADMLTQLLLRTGRPHGGTNWKTTRHLVVDVPEMLDTVKTAIGRSSEIGLIEGKTERVGSQTLAELLEQYTKNGNENDLMSGMKINAEYRQLQLVGDSTRFAVQDTFRDRLVIEPFKKALSSERLGEFSASRKLLNEEMNKVLNNHNMDGDISLRLESGKSGTELNSEYVRNTFFGSMSEAKNAWWNVMKRSAWTPSAWVDGTAYRAVRTWSEIRRDLNLAKNDKIPALEAKSFTAADTALELYRVGENLMRGVISRDTGGSTAGALRSQAVKIASAAELGAVSKADQKAFREVWETSKQQLQRQQYRANGVLLGAMTAAQAAEILQLRDEKGKLDLATARLILAPTYSQALRMIQLNMVDKPAAQEGGASSQALALTPSEQSNAQEAISSLLPRSLQQVQDPKAIGVRYVGDPRLASFEESGAQNVGLSTIGAAFRELPLIGTWLTRMDAQAVEVQRAVNHYVNSPMYGDVKTWRGIAEWINKNPDSVVSTQAVSENGGNWFTALVTVASKALYSESAKAQGLPEEFVAQMAQKNSEQWVGEHQPQITTLQRAYENYGANWLDQALMKEFGADYKFYERQMSPQPSKLETTLQSLPGFGKFLGQYGGVLTSLSRAYDLQYGQPREARTAYARIMQQLDEVKQILPSLRNEQTAVVLGAAMNEKQALAYAAGLENAAQDLKARYGFKSEEIQTQQNLVSAFREPVRQLATLASELRQVSLVRTVRENPVLAATGALAALTLAAGGTTGAMFGVMSLGAVVIGEHWSRNRTLLTAAQQNNMGMKALAVEETRSKGEIFEASLVEQFKAETSATPSLAVGKLSGLLQQRDVNLKVGAQAGHYGHMYLVAAVLSLFERGPLEIKDIFPTISVADASQEGSALYVPRTSAGFFASHRIMDIMMTRAAETIAHADKAADLRKTVEALSFLDLFKSQELSGHPERWTTEFIKSYILNGDELRTNLKEMPEGVERAALQTAYESARKLFNNREYAEKTLADVAQAARSMERDGGYQMQQEEKAIQAKLRTTDPAFKTEVTIAKNLEFENRYGMTREEYKQIAAEPLGLKIINAFAKAEILKPQPLAGAKAVGYKLSGLGVAGLVGAALLAGVSAPVALSAAVVVAGVGLVAAGATVLAQADQAAWKLNPSAYVQAKLQAGRFSPEIQAGLMRNPDFIAAVKGLRVPGTAYVVSEDNRVRAVRTALEYLVGVIQNGETSEASKLGQAREVAQVLKTLQFDLSAGMQKTRTADGQLHIQLTPVAQPPKALLTDGRFQRLVERLNRLGVSLSIPAQWQIQKPMKLKSSDSAA